MFSDSIAWLGPLSLFPKWVYVLILGVGIYPSLLWLFGKIDRILPEFKAEWREGVDDFMGSWQEMLFTRKGIARTVVSLLLNLVMPMLIVESCLP